MLKQLSVTNYALIDHIDVTFDKGLTIITGETGAGKSILLGALGLILGERADSSALRDDQRKCIVEGSFAITDYNLRDFFDSNELDYEALSTLRREIAPGGKSRAFINDTPVNLSVLKELAEKLIDIHSQYETRLLNNADFQLGMVDVYAENGVVKNEYRKGFQQYSMLKARRNALSETLAATALNQSFLEFQFNELETAKIENPGELESLEEQLSVLNHAEAIKQSLTGSYELLQNDENNALQQLQQVKNLLQRSVNFDHRVAAFMNRLDAVIIELKDIASECDNVSQALEFDEEKLTLLNARADLLNRLLSKHRASVLQELIDIRDDTASRLDGISHNDEELKSLNDAIDQQENALEILAEQLSTSRKESISAVCSKVNALLAYLGMPDAELMITIERSTGLKPLGKDDIKFLIKTNKGTGFHSIDKVASGGELSRVMLCLKAVNAERSVMPTIIFDEIDTGVSGEIASKMGDVLKRLGTRMQVISISHLPQIAGKGDAHFKVSKKVIGEKTHSHIAPLNREERIREIAAMISGAEVTEVALQNARVLLES